MLDKIRQFRDGMTEKQHEEIKAAVGDEIYGLLRSMLASENEEQAQGHLDALTKVIEADPGKAVALFENLNAEQKDIVTELVDI